MAISQRQPAPGLVCHSDHGCQYTSFAYGRRLAASELVASMGTVGDALDNAVAESFFATLECELLDRYPWPTRTGLRTAIFDFIEVFYNRQRRHSTLDNTHPPPTNTTTSQQHPPPNHRVHGNGATPCCVWRYEAWFLANCWQDAGCTAGCTPQAVSPYTDTQVAPHQCKERSVLLLAYGFLVGLTAWTFGRRGGPWILRLSEPGQKRVRLAAGMLATAVGAMGIAVLGLQLGGDDHAHVLGWTIGAAVSLGGFVYAAGLLAWRGGQALGLRILGWVLMVTALAIPSTLTLGLPLVALLVVALAPIPEQVAGDGLAS
jgi:Integrase core domain